jgi:hypothetical protein
MRIFKIALPLLFVAGIAVAAARAWTDHADRSARSLAVEHARSEFAQRAAVVRGSPDEVRYRTELKALLRGWFATQTAIQNRWPDQRSVLAPYIAAPRTAPALKLEVDELAGAAVSSMRDGKLDLLFTSQADGLRVDVLRVRRTGKADDARLQIDLAVWGAPEETSAEEINERTTVRTTVPVVFRGLSFRFFDAAGKEIANMPGEGQPRLRVDLPEGLYSDAPPGLLFGRYEPFLFPRDAAQVEWAVAMQTKMPSGEMRVTTATWRSRMDPQWADASGKVWSAPDTVEVEGKEEEPPPAAAKPKAKAKPAKAAAR